MQMVKRVLMALGILWFALLVFMPKQALYYHLEHVLEKEGIVINEDQIEEGPFSLSLKGVSLYFKGIEVATIEEIKLFSLLFYSHAEVTDMLLDDTLKSIVPQKTHKATAVHTLRMPFEVALDANGSFGTIVGHIDLSKRAVRIDFIESKALGVIRTQLKKDEKGLYYETSF